MESEKVKLILKPPKVSKNTVEEMGAFFTDLNKLVAARNSLSLMDKTMCFELVLDDNYIHYQTVVTKNSASIISSLLYTKYPLIEIEEELLTTDSTGSKYIKTMALGLKRHYYFPLKTKFGQGSDPYILFSTLASKLESELDSVIVQLVVKPFSESWLRQFMREKFFFVFGTLNNINLFLEKPFLEKDKIDYYQEVQEKFGGKLFLSALRVRVSGETEAEVSDNVAIVNKVMGKYDNGDVNALSIVGVGQEVAREFDERVLGGSSVVLSSSELSALYHFPDEMLELKGVERTTMKQIEPPINLVKSKFLANPEVSVVGVTNYRNKAVEFGIGREDRRRHVYVIGKTGMGKSKLLELLAISDIEHGHGLCLIDPHGDLAQELLMYIPENRIKDVIYFNPADLEYSMGFNPLECHTPEAKHQVVAGFVAIFKKLFAHSWSNRLEHMLRFVVLALVEVGGKTVVDIVRMLTDTKFRQGVVAELKDPVVRNFWTQEFASWNERFDNEAIIPIINQVGQFIANDYIRYTVGQAHSGFDINQVMQEGKILIINIAKGKLGEENTALLGSMIITKIQEATMARAAIPEAERKDFYLYVDEFQHFATESFNQILSEARKFNLSVTIAHQYLDQLTEEIRKTIFGNMGSFIAFRVGPEDARFLAREFTPAVTQEDFINLNFRDFYAKISIKGKTTEPFSAKSLTLPVPLTSWAEKIIEYSRLTYATPRRDIHDEWSRQQGTLDLVTETGTNDQVEGFEEPLV